MKCLQKISSGVCWIILSIVTSAPAQGQTTNTFPASGNVGIGTTNPNGGMEVGVGPMWSASNLGANIVISGQRNNALGFLDYAGNNAWAIADQGSLTFDFMPPLGDTLDDYTNIMTLTGSGNVGIGIKQPSGGLHVNTGSMWSSYNFGANIVISGLRNNALGFLDHAGNNAWAIADQGSLTFNSMPPLGDISDGPTNVMALTTSGNVGIGTTAPAYKLDIAGQVHTAGGVVYPDGTLQSTAWTGSLCGGDYAESIDVSDDREKYEPGDVLVIDPNVEGKFLKSAEPYSMAVAGVYSTKPGVVGRRQTTAKSPDEIPMAVIGIVPVKVIAENGPIHPGDILVTSATAGYAMKGTDRSRMFQAVIGKAMGSLASGTGLIEVLVSLQ